ncbi:MAG: desulfoferrodoxin FeS4 iron-binding domain-containing protein [Thermoanaerobacterales bacterium]|nr:desulfoferrodoxin FeS4 iron-binding domain-containing protein [Bacillota bacterium]MDI6908055.1 desulfoferrodoxin FeS4 iron-binding domain-containing protein [Thermoanaerobacterales bacterium]
MTENGQVYRCSVCGNIVTVLHAGARVLRQVEQRSGKPENKAAPPEIGRGGFSPGGSVSP